MELTEYLIRHIDFKVNLCCPIHSFFVTEGKPYVHTKIGYFYILTLGQKNIHSDHLRPLSIRDPKRSF